MTTVDLTGCGAASAVTPSILISESNGENKNPTDNDSDDESDDESDGGFYEG